MNKTLALFGLTSLLALGACEITPVECDDECQDNWLDGNPNDTTVDNRDSAHYFRVSKRPDSIPQSVKDTIPVIIAAHGYTATTYEWSEFRDFAGDTLPWVEGRADGRANPSALISLVLLGGHGVDIADFQKSNWKEWGAPILAEYQALVAKGYKNISLAGSSTGCPLILDHVAHRRFDAQPPNRILLIDPIVVPSAKLLTLIAAVGPILGNSPSEATKDELPHWYTNRPQETLNELYSLTNLTKNRLEKGFSLPKGTLAKVWKAKKDALADPIGALLLYKGLTTSQDLRIAVQMVDTKKHVFTRLHGRTSWSSAEAKLQTDTFQEMLNLARR